MASSVPFKMTPACRDELLDLGLSSLEACLVFERGEMVKAILPGRETLRVAGRGRVFFMKRVCGPGWRDVLREARILDTTRAVGLPVPAVAALGAEEGRAVLLTQALPPSRKLEEVVLAERPDAERAIRLGRRLGEIVRRLHDAGVNHRDLYAGHVLVDADDGLHLVDLGRAEVRRRVPLRRVIKDLAALRFSLGESESGRALFAACLERWLDAEGSAVRRRRVERAVELKARRIRAHVKRKLARGDLNVHCNE